MAGPSDKQSMALAVVQEAAAKSFVDQSVADFMSVMGAKRMSKPKLAYLKMRLRATVLEAIAALEIEQPQ